MVHREAAHEAGHLMGLGDRYDTHFDTNGRRFTVAKPGAENDIMGAITGRASADHMSTILAAPGNKRISE
jgi:hypothetical protein